MHKGIFARLALSNIRKNRKIYYPYILTSIITVAMLYMILSLSENEGVGSGTLAFTLELGVFVTVIFSVIFLFYTNSFLMKRRKKEFGLFNVLGMEKKHISHVVILETLIILSVSLVLGLGGGMLVEKLLYLILCRLVGEVAALTFAISISSLITTCTYIAIIFVLITINSLWQIQRAKPIDLLHAGEVGEREPKSRWFLALLGVISLGAGYYISVSITNAILSMYTFFIAVILVIIGTYLLFIAGSVTVLKILRKNKRFYYKTNHFISVSGMIYRMKQNAAGLANICILSTMVLVVVFSTVALWFGVEDIVDKRQRTDISVELDNFDQVPAAKEIVQSEVERANLISGNDLDYTYISFVIYRQGDAFLVDVPQTLENLMTEECIYYSNILTLEDYNRISNSSETLNDGEILIQTTRDAYNEPALSLMGTPYTIKKDLTGSDFNAGQEIMASIYNGITIIVKDMDAFNTIVAQQADVYNKNASQVRHALCFDISGSNEDELAFTRALSTALRAVINTETGGSVSIESKAGWKNESMGLYGGLLFIGLFLGSLFLMAMILIVYYKQISEGYEDKARYGIMRKVGLSKKEIKSSISSQILIVFFLPLVTAGIHIAFAFPSITRMFRLLMMTNTTLIAGSAIVTFIVFSLLYTAVYVLTAKVYYRIVSE